MPSTHHADGLTHEELFAFAFGLTATAAFTIQYAFSTLAPEQPSPSAFCAVPHLPSVRFRPLFCAPRYMPQAWKNYKRGSVVGFSTSGIILKLIGASFLCVNSIVLGESVPVLLYGALSLLQHSFFICQFARYTSTRSFLLWLPFPLVPFVLARLFPASVPFTMAVKPLSQIVSHFPQMWVCYKLRTTSGVSMLTHHLNIVGGAHFLRLFCILIRVQTFTPFSLFLHFWRLLPVSRRVRTHHVPLHSTQGHHDASHVCQLALPGQHDIRARAAVRRFDFAIVVGIVQTSVRRPASHHARRVCCCANVCVLCLFFYIRIRARVRGHISAASTPARGGRWQ